MMPPHTIQQITRQISFAGASFFGKAFIAYMRVNAG
jgi:hypothetical protein